MTAIMDSINFKTFTLQIVTEDNVGMLTLNRPQKGNAQNMDMWEELPKAINALQQAGARSIILTGEGKHFCTGIDLSTLGGDLLLPQTNEIPCQGRSRIAFLSFVRLLQEAMTCFERCRLPIIAAVHGACFGAGIDLITACDIRYATSNARFCVKEVDLGLAADMGTLARLPGIVGDGLARDLALTAREISGDEAKSIHLVSCTFPTKEILLEKAMETAKRLAKKSPLALAGTKQMLLQQRGRTVEEGLDAVAIWNAAVLPGSADIVEIFKARAEGREPLFAKL